MTRPHLPPSTLGPARRLIDALTERCERLTVELRAAERRAAEAEQRAERAERERDAARERDEAALAFRMAEMQTTEARYVELVRSLRDTCNARVNADQCTGFVDRGMQCPDCPLDFLGPDDLAVLSEPARPVGPTRAEWKAGRR